MPLSSAGRKDLVQTETPTRSPDSERTHRIPPHVVDSSPNDYKSAPFLSSSSSSPLWAKKGHAEHEIKPRGLLEAPQEMIVNSKLAENAHAKVTFPLTAM